MAKRFINTEIWNTDEFYNADNNRKLLFFFVLTNCNNIGIFEMPYPLISSYVGFTVDRDLILSIPADIEHLSNNKYWLPKFCFYQYGELKESCRPHVRYMNDLKNLDLLDRVCIWYPKGIQTLKDKDKEQDKDKDKEKDKGKARPKSDNDVLECFIEKGLSRQLAEIEAEKFLNHYEAVGWVSGKNRVPIKSWKGAVGTWIGRINDRSTK